MKNFLHFSRGGGRWLLVVAGLLAGSCSLIGAAAPAPAKPAPTPATAAPAEFKPPVSTFIWKTNDPGFGKDPFFPKSTRPPWAKAKAPPKVEPPKIDPLKPTNSTATHIDVPPPPPPPKRKVELVLQGIGGRTTALINRVSFRVGEVGTVKVSDGFAKIRLDKIMEGAVEVTVWLDDKETERQTLGLGGN